MIILDVIFEPHWNVNEDKIAFHNSITDKVDIFNLRSEQVAKFKMISPPKVKCDTGKTSNDYHCKVKLEHGFV